MQKKELEDQDSIFHYYQKLISYRKGNEVIKEGNYIDLLPHNSKIYAYKRELNGQEIIVVSNFTNKTVKNPLFNKLNGYKLVLSNYNNTNGTLEPFETRVYQNY